MRKQTQTPLVTHLRRLIASRGLSEGKVADAIGVDRGHFNRLCKGAPAGRQVAEKIVKYFDALAGGKGKGGITEMELIYPERYLTDPKKKEEQK